ncbi:MAG: long-chain fatty acid--CoA ligase [Gammaproteobacteria bacterium]|nr:MAG: long-chain fatty acid--CoA ligase [Gammaproteobacteria bacterium]
MPTLHENLITPEQARGLDGLFAQRVRRSPERPAYGWYDRASKAWKTYSWAEMAGQVARWQQAFAAEGIAPGERVALQLRNCPEWVMFDQAALSLGFVTVPLYTDDRPDNIAYILGEAGVRLLLVQDAGRWRRLARVISEESPLQRVLLLDDSEAALELAAQDSRVRVAADWLPPQPGELVVRKDPDPHALASIVYTSGTTGRPKGVMLSHHNMLSVAHGGVAMIDVYQEDSFLSFLPLSHTLERTAGYYLPIMTGSQVSYARSVAQLANDLQEVAPTLMIAVPRIFERVYGRLTEQMAKKGGAALALFRMAVRVGWKRFLRQQGRGNWSPDQLLFPLLDRLVGAKLRARLGGQLRAAVSGGAPLSEDVSKVFIALGVPLLQGYGLTETSPVISVNPLENNIPASVGLPIRGVQVCIGENDELLVKGPGVMKGYWNNHKATTEVIDAEGWLHTGDQARIGDTGHIYITGRIKDILVLSNGEKVPPGDMELALTLDPLIEQAMVVGEGQPYLGALLVLDADHWPGFAQDLGLDPLDPASLRHEKTHKAVLQRVQRALKDFPGYAKIRRVHLTLEPWTVDNGLMTPTLKVKRPKVMERFTAEIEEMYDGGPAS